MDEITNNQTELKAGYVLEHYSIIRTLGRGGFGITYLALDTQRNRPVVLKEFFPANAAFRSTAQIEVSLLSTEKRDEFAEGLRRFQREAMTLSEFKHPNITEVTAMFKANGTAYFVMEYIDGHSLQMALEEQGRAFSEAEIQQQLIPVLNGIKAVHDKGMLHLDIKPDNILTTKYGQPMLIDFGGARFATSQASQDNTSMVATEGYAPPEQYTLSQEQTPATDIYAFGMTLYSLMTGLTTLPGSKDRQTAIFVEDQPDPLKPIRSIAKGYSEALYQTVEACAQVKKSARPQSVADVQALLADLSKPSQVEYQKTTPEAVNKGNPQPKEKKPPADSLTKPDTDQTPDQEAVKDPVTPQKMWLTFAVLFFSIAGIYLYNDWKEEQQRIAYQQEQEPIAKCKQYYDADNYTEASDWCHIAAAQGDADAQYNLGGMYYDGLGVTQDYQQSLQWYRKAAGQGHATAQNILGLQYQYGLGVTQDYQQAVQWFRKAAAQGHANAQYNLGMMYRDGEGVTQDYQQALDWYRKAAAQGSEVAKWGSEYLCANHSLSGC